jgi:hypothetical protein
MAIPALCCRCGVINLRDSTRRRQLLHKLSLGTHHLPDEVWPDPPAPKFAVPITWKLARSLQQAASSSGAVFNTSEQMQRQIFLGNDVTWSIDPDYYNFTSCECNEVRAEPSALLHAYGPSTLQHAAEYAASPAAMCCRCLPACHMPCNTQHPSTLICAATPAQIAWTPDEGWGGLICNDADVLRCC